VNITTDFPCHFPSDIKYLHHPVEDDASVPLVSFFSEAFRFIDEAHAANEAVLVHCQAGISRSPTIVLSYLIRKQSILLKAALTMVTSARKIAHPNIGFLIQLIRFEEEIHALPAKSAGELVTAALQDYLGMDKDLVREVVDLCVSSGETDPVQLARRAISESWKLRMQRMEQQKKQG
jgi:hypothetical protein